jgi:hypothetical protein
VSDKVKISIHELQNRIRTVQEWMLNDHTSQDIIKSGVAKWQVSDRQIQRYIEKARGSFMEFHEESKEKKRAFYIQRMRKALRDLDPAQRRTAQGLAAVGKVLQTMAQIEGIVITKHEVGGLDGQPLSSPVINIHPVTPITTVPIAESEDDA